MKRLHVNIKVADLEQSIAFYQAMFAAEPTVQKEDYAKWMLDDPRVNFAITLAGADQAGIEHLGIQAETSGELEEMYQRIDKAAGTFREEGDTVCCYAKSTKGWIKDPSQVEWEIFYTHGESDTFYDPKVTQGMLYAFDRSRSAIRLGGPSMSRVADKATLFC